MECPEHHIKMVEKYGPYGKFWGCPNFPDCKVTASEHKNGGIMGSPAGHKTKKQRVVAHRLCDKIWGKFDEIDKKQKSKMYMWLKANTSKGHIGLLTYTELKNLNRRLRKMIDNKKTDV